MSLHGSLETFALPDVLTLLSSTKKSGELRVTGPRLDGRVWVHDGRLVASVVGLAQDHVDAVFELLRLHEGEFAFEQDELAPNPGPAVALEPVLADAQARLVVWREIEAVVPSLDAVVRLVPEAPGQEVILRAEQWSVVVAAGSGGTVAEVTAGMNVGEFDACRAVKELVEAGLMAVTVAPVTAAAPAAAAAVLADVADVADAVESDEEAGPDVVGEDDAPPVHAGVDELAELAELAEPETVFAGLADGDRDGAEAEPVLDDDPLTSRLGQLAMARADAGLPAELEDEVDGEEPINRGLLLKFLSSVRS